MGGFALILLLTVATVASISSGRELPTPTLAVMGSAPSNPEARAGPTVTLGPDGLALAIANFSASAARVAIGQTTYLNVSVVGGAPPYAYWYTGLPLRCVSKNVPNLACTPSESQQFNVTVQVNDSAGAHVTAWTEITVWSGWTGPPHIVSFTVVPSTIAVNHLATIYVNATSSSSLGYFFAGLPPGCASFNESVDQCIPSAGGTYHLRVLVQDGFGIVSTSVTDFTVTGGSPSPPPATGPAPLAPWVAPLAIGLVVAGVLGGGVLLLRRGRPPA